MRNKHPTFVQIFIAFGCLTLVACGGGGGSTTPGPPNVAPTANAGDRQYVETGSVVKLNGGASSDANGDPLTYSWSLSADQGGSVAVLSNPTSATPTFVADSDPRGTTYVATLIVNDGKVSSTPVTVNIAATPPGVSIFEVDVTGREVLSAFPYFRSRIQTATVIGQPAVTVATFKLVSQSGSFTIRNLSAGPPSTLYVPSFVGLVDGQVVATGQPIIFSLQSTFTRGVQPRYLYQFEVAETLATFNYDVRLTTN